MYVYVCVCSCVVLCEEKNTPEHKTRGGRAEPKQQENKHTNKKKKEHSKFDRKLKNSST